MKVLMTGVAGMIGSHLLDAMMERGDEVIGVDDLSFGSDENIRHHYDKPRFKFYKVDIQDLNSLRILGRDMDWIVHLAAVKKIGEKQSSMLTLLVNAQGTQNVLDVANMWNCKVLFASTSDIYGSSTDIPLREDGDLVIGPSMVRRWSYAVSKLYGEQICFAYYRDFGVKVAMLRYFGAFSPRASFQWSGGHIPIFIRRVLDNEPLTVHGDGSQTRSMGFVTDLVKGTLLAMERESAIGEVINIGNDEEMSVLDSAKLIHRIADTGHELKLDYVPMAEVCGPGYRDIMRRIPDLTKARKLLGYKPEVSIEVAIRSTIASIKSSKGHAVAS